MRFPPSFIDEIRARLPVSEVVRGRVKLQKSGREWKGLSPFNTEKTPSFFVNDQKGFYHDFSSGNSGTIFDFVMATEGLSFPEAVERLAGQAGLALPRSSPAEAERETRRAGLHELLEWSAAYFEAALATSEGARARAYLAERGIGEAARAEFRLGYAPGPGDGGSDARFGLRNHLASRGASREAMIEAGLLIHGDDIAVPYDRFRGRIMFPIQDRTGRVIAFGGRALDKDVPAKYLNSPETPLFHKGAVLFNHHRARRAAHSAGALVVVEGYIDAIALSQAGFGYCVAPLGTALTPQHCELIWQMAEEPVVCLDGDAAGRKAAYRVIDTVLPLLGAGRTLRFAVLPDGKDPDDLVRAEGAAALTDVLARATPLAEMIWNREWERSPLTTPEQRVGLERRLAAVVAQIGDAALRRYYEEEMAARLAAVFGRGGRAHAGAARPLRSAAPAQRSFPGGFRGVAAGARLGIASQPLTTSTGLKQSALVVAGRPATREVHILLLVLNHPDLLRRHAEDLAALEFASREFGRLRDVLIALDCDAFDHAGVRAAVDAAGLAETRQRIEAAAAGLSLWCARPEAAEVDAGAALSQALTLHHKARSLHRELDRAVLDYAGTDTEANLARLNQLRADISDLHGIEATLEGFGTLSGRVGSDM